MWRVVLTGFLALILLPALLAGAGGARAGDEAVAAQQVIRSQDQALSRDDAAAAFSYAAPGIAMIYRDADTFFAMVRLAYAPVYRHRSFEFGTSRLDDGKIIQQVNIVDADGEAWEAIYTLEPQPDGSLKISGCMLRKAVDA
jgi:hypothetical protein